jgi:hypothetical protein
VAIAWNLVELLARLVGTVPRVDHTVELQDLRLEDAQLSAERGDTRARDFRHPFVFWIGDDPEHVLDTFASDWRDNLELSKVRTDRIDHCGLLADEQLARAMQHQTALVLRCLGRNEPHVWPGDRLADRLGVSGIVLMSLDVWLHIGRRHQADCVSKCLEFA